MKRRSAAASLLLASFTIATLPASAQQIEQVIVYIECTAPQNVPNPGQIVRGSGVIVSREGHVLTAKHVAPADYTCRGGIGTASIQPIRSLLHDSRQVHIDATLLKFVPIGDEQFPFLRYHPIEASLRRKPITAHGFPASPGVGVGAVYSTQGIIAQTPTNTQGIFGTDALQSGGMSGGPVVLNSDGSLVGIIVGATFGADGAPASYGVLAASEVAGQLGLTRLGAAQPAPVSCPIRTVRIDKTQLATNSVTPITREYSEPIQPDEGCRLVRLTERSRQSENNVENLRYEVSPDGAAGYVKFSLRSGPVFDQWRGWLQTDIQVEQAPRR